MKNRIWLLVLMVGLYSCVQEKDRPESVVRTKVRTYAQTTEIPSGIMTPDAVETSIGTLHFRDGVPDQKTAELVYENLDRMRAVDVFLKCMPAASMRHLMLNPEASVGFENNWLQTIPGKSWFVILRMYGPLEPWINKTWRPSEIELVKQ